MQNFRHGEKLTRWYHSVDDTKDTDDTKVLKNFTATYLTNSLLSNICLMTGPWTAPKNFPTCTTQCTAEWNKEHNEVLLNSRSFWFWFCFCFIVCYAMLCCAVLCCAVLCCVCCAVCAVLCCAVCYMLCYAMLCCAVCCAVCYMLCCAVLWFIFFVSFRFVQLYTVLYCTVLYCTVLYCSALFCVILRFKNPTLSYKVKVEMQSQKVRSLNLTVLQTSKPKKCVKNWKEPLV